eukprot:SAG31_NODE_1081_length_10014_cov_16.919617_4_plen_421_part_00
MATLGILSFGPILMPYIVGRWLLLSAVATVAFGFLCIAGAAVCLIAWSSCLDYTDNHRTENAPATASSRLLQSCIRTCRRTNFAMRAWVAFVMPCYSLFVLLVVAAFSGLWSIAVGACIFIQGEAFAEWNGGTKRRWPLFMRFCEYFFVGPVLNYFPLRIFLADDASKLELERKYIFGYHPHGVYSFGLFALVFGHSSGFNRIFGSARPATPAPPPVGELWTRWQSSGGSVPTPRSLLVGVANVLLMVPICGNIVAWFGFIPASRRSLETACNTEVRLRKTVLKVFTMLHSLVLTTNNEYLQHNLVLVPGGIAEMTAYAGDDTERVHLRDRTGFCRLALRKGRDLVPMFGFGENRTFRQYACCRYAVNFARVASVALMEAYLCLIARTGRRFPVNTALLSICFVDAGLHLSRSRSVSALC